MFSRLPRTPIALAALLTVSGVYAQEAVKTDGQTLETIVVNASADASAEGLSKPYAGGQVARGGRVGILGTQDNMDTPFNVTSYTNELIKNQQARSVADVVQNDPGVRVARGFGNFQELYVIRGFPVYSDDIAYNGLYGMLPRQFVATELIERVEVFRGANTFLNGAAPGGSGIGGAINLMPKRAPNEPLTEVTVGVESGGQGYAALDLARRFGPDQSTGMRFNAVRRDGDTGVDDENRKLSVLSAGFDWHSRDVRLSADIGFQDHKLRAPQPSVTPNGAIPDAPDSSKSFAQPWTYSKERDVFGTFRGEFDLANNVTAWAALGIRHGDESNVLANPNSDANGNTSANRFDNVREETARTAEIGIRAKLNTGSVVHNLTASATTFSLKKRNAFAFYDSVVGNLYDFVPGTIPTTVTFPGGNLKHPVVQAKTNTSSVALADTMGFMDERLLLTLGARYQNIGNRTYDYATGVESPLKTDEDRVTPVVGLVFKATEEISIYGNYIEALVDGGNVGADTGGVVNQNAGQALSPFVSKQKEVGIKYDGGRLGGSVSVFMTDRATSIAQNGFVSTDGKQENKGLEINLYGELQKGLRALGGITFLDAKQKSTTGSVYDGKNAVGVPDRQANAGLEWDVPGVAGLTLTGRAVYTGSQYASADNVYSIPSWTRYDLGARYLTTIGGKLVTFRARLDNATDKNYWASVGGASINDNYLVLGAPRTLALTASIEF
jgi:iron complex outermembrane receptor protein